MSKKRDIVDEIELRNIRSDYSSKYGFTSRLYEIDNLVEKIKDLSAFNLGEIIRYIPIATIATTESFFRYLYKEIIDSNDKYLKNAISYAKAQSSLKFDLDYLSALQGKRVTIGEIISHLLQLNNLDDINKTLSNLLGIDFLDRLKNYDYKEASPSLSLGHTKRKFTSIIKSVSSNFDLRHILCHEFALNVKINRVEIIKCYEDHKLFLRAANYLVENEIGIYTPEFQQGMNIRAAESFEKAEQELVALISVIKKVSKSNSSVGFL